MATLAEQANFKGGKNDALFVSSERAFLTCPVRLPKNYRFPINFVSPPKKNILALITLLSRVDLHTFCCKTDNVATLCKEYSIFGVARAATKEIYDANKGSKQQTTRKEKDWQWAWIRDWVSEAWVVKRNGILFNGVRLVWRSSFGSILTAESCAFLSFFCLSRLTSRHSKGIDRQRRQKKSKKKTWYLWLNQCQEDQGGKFPLASPVWCRLVEWDIRLIKEDDVRYTRNEAVPGRSSFFVTTLSLFYSSPSHLKLTSLDIQSICQRRTHEFWLAKGSADPKSRVSTIHKMDAKQSSWQ